MGPEFLLSKKVKWDQHSVQKFYGASYRALLWPQYLLLEPAVAASVSAPARNMRDGAFDFYPQAFFALLLLLLSTKWWFLSLIRILIFSFIIVCASASSLCPSVFYYYIDYLVTFGCY